MGGAPLQPRLWFFLHIQAGSLSVLPLHAPSVHNLPSFMALDGDMIWGYSTAGSCGEIAGLSNRGMVTSQWRDFDWI